MLDNVCLGVGYSHQSGVCLSERPIYLLLYQLAKYYRKGYFAYRLWHLLKKYYAQTGDQDDLISIGTIGLIKGISTFKADKNVRLATYASRCIENEILMYFRSQRKLQGEVSLTETLETGGDGNSLSLMDVLAVDDDLLEELERLRALALNYLGLELTVGVGLSCATLGELRQSTEGARSALDYRVLMGGGRVLYIGDIEPGTSAELSLDEDDQRELANAVKLGTAEQVEELVCSLIERLRKHRMDLAQCSLFLLELTTALIRLARAGDVELEAVFGPGFTGVMPISQFRSLDELEHWCVDRCLNLRELLGRQRSDSAWRTVERAKHYIGQHYADSELSVESVCTHLHLSPAYFSTLFKREEGMSFIAYVTNVRMERAAQLLLESDDKTYLIAEKTGYTDPNYFSYVFKRRFGISPSKYRAGGER